MLATAPERSLDQLRDLYAEEVGYHATLADMLRRSTLAAQIATLDMIRHQTRTQIGRLVRIFELFGARCYHRRPSGERMAAGPASRPPSVWGSDPATPAAIFDTAIEAADQAVSAYAAALTDARLNGFAELTILLEQSLAEERSALELLTKQSAQLDGQRVPATSES